MFLPLPLLPPFGRNNFVRIRTFLCIEILACITLYIKIIKLSQSKNDSEKKGGGGGTKHILYTDLIFY